jgi:hypothetical protein
MSDSLTEIIVERFYRSRGYLVERDVPIVAENEAQHWSDLDILAIKDEVHLVNCKDFVADPKQKNKIADNLKTAEEWVRRNYVDLVADKPIVRKLVYIGSDEATITCLQNDHIDCYRLEKVLAEYLAHLESSQDKLNGKYAPPKGKRWYRTGNRTSYDKFLVYLLNEKFLKVEDGKIRTWEK